MSTLTKQFSLAVLLATLSISCTVKGTETPPLTGPSGPATRVLLSLDQDSILKDGLSQTRLNIEVIQADGRPWRGLTLRIEMVVDGIFYDFGTLSAKTVVTGDDGKARSTYTSPPPDGTGTVVT